MTVEEMAKEIAERGDSSYFDHDFAQFVQREWSVPVIETQEMVRDEADCQIRDGRFKNRKNQYGLAIQQACDNVLAWLTHWGEWQIAKIGDPLAMAKFVSSHRRACVWAVLVGMTKGNEGRTRWNS